RHPHPHGTRAGGCGTGDTGPTTAPAVMTTSPRRNTPLQRGASIGHRPSARDNVTRGRDVPRPRRRFDPGRSLEAELVPLGVLEHDPELAHLLDLALDAGTELDEPRRMGAHPRDPGLCVGRSRPDVHVEVDAVLR